MSGEIQRLQAGLPTIRKMIGINATYLSNALNVTRQSISNLETGKNKMTMTQYIAIRSIISHRIAQWVGNMEISVTLYSLIDGYLYGVFDRLNPGEDPLELLQLFSAFSPPQSAYHEKFILDTAKMIGFENAYSEFQARAEVSGVSEKELFLTLIMEWMERIAPKK